MRVRLCLILLLQMMGLIGVYGGENKLDHYQLFEKREGFWGSYFKEGDSIEHPGSYSVMIFLNPNKINFSPVPGDLFGGTVDDEIHYEYYVKNDKERTISFYKKNKMHILTIKFIDLDKFQIIEVGEWIDLLKYFKGSPKEQREYLSNFWKKLDKADMKETRGAISRFEDGGYYDLERVYTCF